MIIIGLTGPTGAGKTTACLAFRRLGAKIIDADQSARAVTAKGAEVLRDLADVFGGDIIKNGELDRKELARRAFADGDSTEKLNSILLPVIKTYIDKQIEAARADGCKAVVLDAPTLFEAGCETLCDVTVAVLLDSNIRRERIINRDKLSPADADVRLNAGKTDEFYKFRVNYILYNNGSAEELGKAAEELYRTIMK